MLLVRCFACANDCEDARLRVRLLGGEIGGCIKAKRKRRAPLPRDPQSARYEQRAAPWVAHSPFQLRSTPPLSASLLFARRTGLACFLVLVSCLLVRLKL